MRDAEVVSVTPLLTDTEWIETTLLHTRREFSSKFNQLEMNTQTEVSIRMSKEAEQLIREYNIEAELIEALLLRYGGEFDTPSIDDMTPTHRLVYQFLEDDGDSPIRTAEDHFYQFDNYSEYGQEATSPGVETAFEAILSDLVAEGLIARTNEEVPRYSASFYNLLAEIDRDWSASKINQFCAETGVDKRQVYYHILTDLHLNVDLTE